MAKGGDGLNLWIAASVPDRVAVAIMSKSWAHLLSCSEWTSESYCYCLWVTTVQMIEVLFAFVYTHGTTCSKAF